VLIRKTLVGLTGDADANITYESVDCNGRLSAWAERQCRLCVGLIGVGRNSMNTITLYRPTGPEELELVKQSGYLRWPPRMPEQPIFYPVTNELYATEIDQRWNIKDSKVGYVTRFNVRANFMSRYELQKVGGAHHTEWWVPAEELEALNDNIVGKIEVIGEYR